jgi:alpha-galactosidase
MGWNSWNCWAHAVDDKKIRDCAKAMVDSGLIDHGWSYVNIDDCWMVKPDSNDPLIGGEPRDGQGMLIPNKNFPDMPALTEYIHGLGLKAGIYISPGPLTCQLYVGSWEHEAQDGRLFAEWGFDYPKYDWCGYEKVSIDHSLEELQKPYKLMGDILADLDRDIVYSLCQYGWGDVWQWGQEMGGNCWRTTGDIVDSWGSMSYIGFSQDKCSAYAKPGHWNDPDMLVVGKVGWGPNLHPTRLTPDEQYTHISLWCLLSAPLLIGCDLTDMDEFTLSLLTNDEVLDVDQDPLGDQAKRIVYDGDKQIWAKDMEDGSKAVGLFNLNKYDEDTLTVTWADLGISGKHKVRDLWRHQDITVSDTDYSAKVPVHGVVLIRVIPQ